MGWSRCVALALGVMAFLLTGAISPVLAANVNLLNYMETRVGERLTYTYDTPQGFADFSVTLTKLTSGPFAGKSRIGDYLTPNPTREIWRVIGWDTADPDNAYIYATNKGVFDPPLALPLVHPLNTLVAHPFENSSYWYFQSQSSLTVPAGTYNDILIWINLDGAYPPNAWHDTLGLDRTAVPQAVTSVTYHARGIGEIRSIDVDAATGTTLFDYRLKDLRLNPVLPFVPLMLLP